MALGTFIIGGLVSVFIGASRSYTVQQALVEVQSKGRFSIQKLREDIQLAGLGIESSDTPVRIVLVGGTTDCDNSTYDVLEIVFNEDEAVNNTIMCYYLNTATNALMRDQTIAGTAATGAQEVTIIDQVEQSEFLFAVDTNGGGVDVVSGDIYQSAATLTAAASPNWEDVVAVRIELIVASNTQRVLDTPQRLINPFDKNPAVNFEATGYSTSDTSDDDLSLHQAYTALVSLRNRML